MSGFGGAHGLLGRKQARHLNAVEQRAVPEQNGHGRLPEVVRIRIRRAYAENTVRARDEFPDQAALVLHQAGLKRRHMPVRDFVRNAPDVLLALKPCWAMSPLVVSQLLPPLPYFDVVIFDEASQIAFGPSRSAGHRARCEVPSGSRARP